MVIVPGIAVAMAVLAFAAWVLVNNVRAACVAAPATCVLLTGERK
jgi:hypothetical protein